MPKKKPPQDEPEHNQCQTHKEPDRPRDNPLERQRAFLRPRSAKLRPREDSAPDSDLPADENLPESDKSS